MSGVTAIAALTGKGRWDHTLHLRCCCLHDTGSGLNRVMVSVPKRLFKRAVKRNLLKRRMREAYRLQKDKISGTGHDFLFVYNAPEVLDFSVIYDEVGAMLQKFGK